jgi:Flp pilus assembly protein TadD
LAWDDDENFLKNLHYRGFGWENLKWMFTTFYLTSYQPLGWMLSALDYRIWGLNPFGYHLTNLILHGLNAVCLYLLSRRLLEIGFPRGDGRTEHALRAGAVFSALGFSLHPLRAELVASAPGRSYLLAAFFLLCSAISYLKHASRPPGARRRPVGSLVFYGLSLLSKGIGVGFPLVLLVLDFFPLGRLRRSERGGAQVRSVLLEKIPYLVLAVALGALPSMAAKANEGALLAVERYGWIERIGQCSYALLFYLWKTLFPCSLAAHYGPWARGEGVLAWAGTGVVALALLVVLAARRLPIFGAVGLIYLILLLPFSGLARYNTQAVADRWCYLACMGWGLVVGAGWVRMVHRGSLYGEVGRPAGPAGQLGRGIGMALVLMALLCTEQVEAWESDGKLWADALRVNVRNYYAYSDLSVEMAESGRASAAAVRCRRALRLNPGTVYPRFNLAKILIDQGHLEEAADHLQYLANLVVEHPHLSGPHMSQVHHQLGMVRIGQRRWEEAAEQLRKALSFRSDSPETHNNLGVALCELGRLEEAAAHFEEALRIKPDHLSARYNWGRALLRSGRPAEAIPHLQEVLRARPDFPGAREALSERPPASAEGDGYHE